MKHETYSAQHPYVIVFGFKTEESLINAMKKVEDMGYKIFPFYEPDQGNTLTSFSTTIIERTEAFRKFQLLK